MVIPCNDILFIDKILPYENNEVNPMDAKEKINTILCDALSDCANPVGGNSFLLRKIHSKLPTEAVHMNIENGDFLLVSQLLNAIGNILQ